ncbi:MAG: hypothetical protein KKH22_07170 [Proteobacteria bacterium]|nr:hypothetical protein [Pseudomonadota bacterium]
MITILLVIAGRLCLAMQLEDTIKIPSPIGLSSLSFAHFEMFKVIVVGIVMLSTFLYSGVLLTFIGLNQEVFPTEQSDETY